MGNRNFVSFSQPRADTWHHAGMLHTGMEDYPPGAASFYHSCHFQERTEYCLYGHVAALTYLAKYTTEEDVSQDFARHAMRLLHWNLCLDFLESSTWASWGFSILTLWDMVQNFVYPQVSLLHQYLDWGPGTAPNAMSSSEAQGSSGSSGSSGFWVLELGTHRALSNEPVSMLKHVLSNYDVVHENPIKPYQGRAEAFVHPFPRSCSPNCPHQQLSGNVRVFCQTPQVTCSKRVPQPIKRGVAHSKARQCPVQLPCL